jgi:hypothetical protein
MANQADSCCKYGLAKLIDEGWDNSSPSFTPTEGLYPGRMVISRGKVSHRLKSFLRPGPTEGDHLGGPCLWAEYTYIMIGVVEKFGFCK